MATTAHRRKRPNERWHDVGAAAELARTPLQQIQVHGTRMALSCVDDVFGAIHGSCNHAGGPLGQGTLEGDYVVCPWHQWRFHRIEGHGERGFEQDVVPAYRVRVRGGRVQVSVTPHVKRHRTQHAPHPLAREPERAAGPVRVVGISTTAMNLDYPALLHLRRAAGRGARARPGDRLRHAADPAARALLPPLRGLLLEVGARLHLALLDHADGPRGPARPRLRGAGALGRRVRDRDADPLGRAEQPLLQDDRAHELHPEPAHDRGPHAAPEQGADGDHHGRSGQHPGGRRADARLLHRARLPHPAVRLHRALARLERRGHGAQRRGGAAQRGAAGGGGRAGGSRRRARAAAARDRGRGRPAAAAARASACAAPTRRSPSARRTRSPTRRRGLASRLRPSSASARLASTAEARNALHQALPAPRRRRRRRSGCRAAPRRASLRGSTRRLRAAAAPAARSPASGSRTGRARRSTRRPARGPRPRCERRVRAARARSRSASRCRSGAASTAPARRRGCGSARPRSAASALAYQRASSARPGSLAKRPPRASACSGSSNPGWVKGRSRAPRVAARIASEAQRYASGRVRPASASSARGAPPEASRHQRQVGHAQADPAGDLAGQRPSHQAGERGIPAHARVAGVGLVRAEGLAGGGDHLRRPVRLLPRTAQRVRRHPSEKLPGHERPPAR